MSARIYLHVGQHKTGTTQIQRYLGSNPELLSLNNYEYPLITKHSDHQYLHKYFVGKKHQYFTNAEPSSVSSDKVSQLIDYIKNTDKNIILSSEGLQAVSPEKLRKLFSDLNVVIVIYVREQASYLFSAYQQEVKSGAEYRSFAEWFHSMGDDLDVYHLNSWISQWERVFGDQNVIVRAYDKTKLINGDVLSDFLNVVGLSELMSIPKKDNTDFNLRMGLPSHNAMRVINMLGRDRHEILTTTFEAIDELSNSEKFQTPIIGCDEMLVKKIRTRSSYENTLLANRRFDGELFCCAAIPSEPTCSMYSNARALISIIFKSFKYHPLKTAKLSFHLIFNLLNLKIPIQIYRSNISDLQAKCHVRDSLIP